MVLTALPHLEVACLDSAQRFDDNQQFMEQRIRQEDNPKVRHALEQDREFLDSIQLEMSTARQFVLALRFKNEKDSQIFSRINDARKALHDEGFEAWRMGPSGGQTDAGPVLRSLYDRRPDPRCRGHRKTSTSQN